MGVSQAGCQPRAGGQLPLGGYLGGETESELQGQKPVPTHPGAGCHKCGQLGGSGIDGWSLSFSLL